MNKKDLKSTLNKAFNTSINLICLLETT